MTNRSSITSALIPQDPQAEDVFIFPASFAQQRLWFLHQMAPDNPFYNVSIAMRLQGPLDRPALEQTLHAIMQRHESLRTTFMVEAGELVQVVAAAPVVPLMGWHSLSQHAPDTLAEQKAIEAAQQSFNLLTGPLLRVVVIKRHETDHLLLLVLHHIIADGWSMGVLLRELSVLYRAFCKGEPSPLPELPIQYADFACWQRQWLQGDVLATQRAYWQQTLQAVPLLDLPTDYVRPPVLTYRGATESIEFSPTLSQALETFSQQQGVSLFMTLLAAFQLLLHRYTGQDDIAIGSPIANRHRRELEDLIGFFVNSLVLRTDLSGNPTVHELLDRVREVALNAYAHQDLPFEQLVQDLHPQRDLSHHPLFQVALALQNMPIDTLELPNLQVSQIEMDSGTTRLDLEFHLWHSPKGLSGQITYSTDLFKSSTIARMLAHFQILLQQIVQHPDRRISEISLLTSSEQQQFFNQQHQISHQILHQVSNSLCIHQIFAERAQQMLDAIAVVCEDEHLSYQALNYRSNQLAHYLQQLGVQPDRLVGICLERSIDMIVAVLGVLKAGGAYVPLDPAYPQERLQFILDDTQAAILITHSALAVQLASDRHVLCVDRDRDLLNQQPLHQPTSTVTPTNLAYVIYTSGSTGQPKGVLIEHRGLCNVAQAQQQIFSLQPSDRVLQFASLSFDASMFEMILAWQAGATLYPIPAVHLSTRLTTFLRNQAITVATLPPAVLRLLSPADLPALTTIISAGEACSSELVARWSCGDRRFFNAYGPTEATIWSTIWSIIATPSNIETANTETATCIGQAIPNVHLYVLDKYLQPVPVGIPGELFIGGTGLARGYLNHFDLTVRSFVQHPFISNQRLYQTGDRAQWRSDGSLEFLGRLDHQVKIRGFRVEIGDVETHLSHHPAIQETAVVTPMDESGHQQLVAYVVFHSTPSSTSNSILYSTQSDVARELRCFLQSKLPHYCVPSRFVVLGALPRLPSGKIDRPLLRHLPHSSLPSPAFVAPRTPLESSLAALWSQVLDREPIGVTDNFFDLGGDSLSAMQVMDQLHHQFQQDLPLSALFFAPTIAQLAMRLETPKSNPLSSPPPLLVPLQPMGNKTPFFCVHPVFGVVFPYMELARQLGTDRPFYGVQPVGLTGCAPDTCIKEMASRYLSAIRQVQPQGPYLLGGWSFGGLVAFEMAHQLQQVGQSVSFLAVLDTPAPIASNQPSLGQLLTFFGKTGMRSIIPFVWDYLTLLVSRSQTQSNRKFTPWLMKRQQQAIANLIPQEAKLRMLNEFAFKSIMHIFQANSLAAHRYRPASYSSKIGLFRTADSLAKQQDPTLGWQELTTETVEVYSIAGNHLTMMRDPHVSVLAEQMRICFAKFA